MRRTRLLAAAILPLVNLVAQSQNSGPRASSCDAIRKRLERNGLHMAMIDMVPDLVRDSGIITDSEKLATTGRPVTGVAADGASIALLRFPANFPVSGCASACLTAFNSRAPPLQKTALCARSVLNQARLCRSRPSASKPDRWSSRP